MRHLYPTLTTLFILSLVIGAVIFTAGGDPLELARLGTRFTEANPNGTEGYDGQFVYYIARSPRPSQVSPLLDIPAYRYQRILLPLLVRLFSFGNLAALPWVLALLGLLSQTVGTWLVSELLAGWGVNRWYALVYGLFPGFVLAVRLDLPEPLAFGLVAGALLARRAEKQSLAWLLFGLALFAKETVAIFIAAQLLADLVEQRWKAVFGLGLVTLLPYGLFQAWLWLVFGQPGLGSGGAMATSFEIIPFMGLLQIGTYSLAYLAAMLAVFGPAVVLPTIWGAFSTIKNWLKGEKNVIVLALFLNALSIAFLPFSTFRETGGLLRFACGLALAVLLYGAKYKMKRVLNYSVLWIVLNVFLLKS